MSKRRKKKKHARSILEQDPAVECFECGCINNLEEHHIFYGSSDREKSEAYGLKVHLCYEHHRGNKGIHSGRNKELDIRLKRMAQRAFEERYGHEAFTREFAAKNTLEENEQIWK